jgi:hypothetical protein
MVGPDRFIIACRWRSGGFRLLGANRIDARKADPFEHGVRIVPVCGEGLWKWHTAPLPDRIDLHHQRYDPHRARPMAVRGPALPGMKFKIGHELG